MQTTYKKKINLIWITKYSKIYELQISCEFMCMSVFMCVCAYVCDTLWGRNRVSYTKSTETCNFKVLIFVFTVSF